MEQDLNKWKAAHGNVLSVTVGENVSYFREPSIAEFSFAQGTSQGDGMRMLSDLMEKCFLGGFNYKEAQGFSTQMAYVSAFSKALEPKTFEVKNV